MLETTRALNCTFLNPQIGACLFPHIKRPTLLYSSNTAVVYLSYELSHDILQNGMLLEDLNHLVFPGGNHFNLRDDVITSSEDQRKHQ